MLSAVSSHVSLRSSASMHSFQTLQDDENSSTQSPSLSQRNTSASSPRTMSTSTNTSSPKTASRESPSRSFIPSPPPLSRVSGGSGGGSGGSLHNHPPLHTVVLKPDAAPYAQLCFDQQLNTMTTLLVGRVYTSLLERHQQEYQGHEREQQHEPEPQNPELTDDLAPPVWSPFTAPNMTWTYSSEEDSSGWSSGSSSFGDDSSEEEEILPQGIIWLDRNWLFDQDRRLAYDDHRALLLDSDDSSDEVGTGENCSKSSSGTTTIDTRCGCLLRRGFCINNKKDQRSIAAHHSLAKSNAVYGGKSYGYESLGG